jgi:HlyD family secretion protein
METLYRDGVGTEQGLELQRSARDEASREVERVRATLGRFGGGSGQADRVVAERQVEVARAEAARAEAELERAYIRAPQGGTVLTVHGRVGERPGASGLLSLGDLGRMKVEVEVYQAQIREVGVGSEAECEADGLPGKLRGVVERVGLEVGRQRLIDMNPAANTDARVVRVTVALDDASPAVARRFSNLQVTARIWPGGGS